ncbi:MAG: hypothetical protein ACRDQ2_12105, partial [Gaiellales bacterium]
VRVNRWPRHQKSQDRKATASVSVCGSCVLKTVLVSEPIILRVDRESEALIDGFALSLGAENKAPRSVEIYSDAVTQFVGWLEENAGSRIRRRRPDRDPRLH